MNQGLHAVGFDIGGTKTHVLSNQADIVKRYDTADFESPYGVIDRYLSETNTLPAAICVGIAAVRNSVDGSVRLVKRDWPVFRPAEASIRYNGAKLVTANDIITTAVGIFEGKAESERLKAGTPIESDPTLVYTWSTGIGAAVVVPGDKNQYLPSATGHAGLAPQYESEIDYLRFVSKRHQGKLSIEFAVAGQFGIDNLVDFYLEKNASRMTELHALLTESRVAGIPTGQMLVSVAKEGDGVSRAMAQKILNQLGGLMGYALRNQVLAIQVGHIKMTGSVALNLMPYLAQHTPFIERFVDQDARCADIPEAISIDLVKDPHVAVKGSLLLATKELERI